MLGGVEDDSLYVERHVLYGADDYDYGNEDDVYDEDGDLEDYYLRRHGGSGACFSLLHAQCCHKV